MGIYYEISAHTCLKDYVDENARTHQLQGDKYQKFSESRMIAELDMMRELGIKWFNTWANSDVYSDNEDDILFADKLYQYLERYSEIRLSSLHYIGSVFEMDEKKNEENRQQMKRVIDLFAKCRPITIVMHPGTFGEGGFKKNLPNYQHAVSVYGKEKVKEMVADNIRYFGKLAAEYNIKIAVENIYKGRVYSIIDDLIDLVETVNLENVGYCFDIGHGNYDGVDICQTIRRMSNKLFELHLTDNFGDRDGHLPIGFGNINWVEVVQTLSEINYNGRATFEFFRWPIGDRKLGLQLAIYMWEAICKIASEGYSTYDYM